MEEKKIQNQNSIYSCTNARIESNNNACSMRCWSSFNVEAQRFVVTVISEQIIPANKFQFIFHERFNIIEMSQHNVNYLMNYILSFGVILALISKNTILNYLYISSSVMDIGLAR